MAPVSRSKVSLLAAHFSAKRSTDPSFHFWLFVISSFGGELLDLRQPCYCPGGDDLISFKSWNHRHSLWIIFICSHKVSDWFLWIDTRVIIMTCKDWYLLQLQLTSLLSVNQLTTEHSQNHDLSVSWLTHKTKQLNTARTAMLNLQMLASKSKWNITFGLFVKTQIEIGFAT